MKRIAVFVLAIFVTTLLSGCLPTNQAEQALDLVFGKPRIKSTSPEDGAEEISLDSKIIIEFNKDINEETLSSKTIVIEYLNENLDFYVNPFLGSKYEYNNDDKTLTIEPKDDFLPNQEIEVRLLSNIKSKGGTELARTSKSGDSDNIKYVFKFKTKAE